MEVFCYSLEGRIPAKKDSQRIFKTKGGKPFITASKAYKDWEKETVLLLKTLKNHETINKCEMIVINLIYGDLRVKDNTNTADSIMDALVKAKIIKDDCWMVTGEVVLKPKYQKGFSGATICLYT